MAAKQKYSHIIHRLHDQWCLDNGYKLQATSWRPKVSSAKRQASSSSRSTVPSVKRATYS